MSEPDSDPSVSGAVTALLAAYKNASSIVESIKKQCKASGIPAPSDALEESLQEGYWEIEKIEAQGMRRFGAAFEKGDGRLNPKTSLMIRESALKLAPDIAFGTIRDLTIELQSSFLALACRNEDSIDFEACVDATIGVRLRAVNILNELYLRQQRPSASRPESEVMVSPLSPATKPLPDPLGSKSNEMKEVLGASAPSATKQRRGTLESNSSGGRGSERSSGSIRLSRVSSWGVSRLLQRTPSAEQTSMLPPHAYNAPSHTTSPSLSPQTMPMMSPQLRLTEATPQPQIMTPPISPITPVGGTDALAAAGFCKGAYYVQQGLLRKGLQLSAKNMDWTSHCRKCPFATPADQEGGRPRFDDKPHSTSKMRWRTLVLFKSHLSSSQKKSRLYKCLICVLMGGSSCVIDGESELLEHMFTHQGSVLKGVELWGPLCLESNRARVGTESTFDICFLENPRFALPEGAFEMSIATEIFEADGTEVYGRKDSGR